MRIKRDETIAVVIDVQEKLFPLIYDNENLSLRAQKLIRGLKVLQIPLLLTEQYPEGIGPTITDIRSLFEENFGIIKKMSFSCCGSNEFTELIRISGKKNILLLGIESHVCVLQTAVDLIADGYNVIIIEDCVSSRSFNDKVTAIKRMRTEGAYISTYESILFELTQTSEAKEFREISKIVK